MAHDQQRVLTGNSHTHVTTAERTRQPATSSTYRRVEPGTEASDVTNVHRGELGGGSRTINHCGPRWAVGVVAQRTEGSPPDAAFSWFAARVMRPSGADGHELRCSFRHSCGHRETFERTRHPPRRSRGDEPSTDDVRFRRHASFERLGYACPCPYGIMSGSSTVGEGLSWPSWLAGGPPWWCRPSVRAVVSADPRATVAATRTGRFPCRDRRSR
jgi:hypothetical protein